ncbi:MAG: 3-dehydroquinate synthase [bacterium]
MINLKVELGNRTYPIFIGSGILEKLGEMFKLYGFGQQVIVVTDTNVQKLYAQVLTSGFNNVVNFFEIIALPPGENSKSLSTIEKIITKMLALGCDRNVTILAFGGGVIGDIAGFTASIYKRGVTFIQVPTTLLAQVDASVGGKTGVNHPLGKNMIGTFYQPKLVWIDLEVLKTLPKREILCGLAEIIKYGVVWDADLFCVVENNLEKILALDLPLLEEIVKCCCEIKAAIVAKDEKESGLRMILNFGHTVGHALEAAMGYKKINHGEAVLLGMLAESKIALQAGQLNVKDFNRIQTLISIFNLKNHLKYVGSGDLFNFMKKDKKAIAGKLRFVLPKKIGEVYVADLVRWNAIAAGIETIRMI